MRPIGFPQILFEKQGFQCREESQEERASGFNRNKKTRTQKTKNNNNKM